ncbi:MAG TPA: ABC transporter permease [Candidatus Limnocylindrales bacterium]|nr:ABC transporter permease [Candidatus Limnocylindrales bacterium]
MDGLEPLVNLAASALRLAAPLILAAMAGILSFKVGLINIALEGLMLIGAFVGVVVGAAAGSALVGLLVACIAAALVAAAFALFVTDLRANLIVAGLAINILAAGATAYLLQVVVGVRGIYAPDTLDAITAVQLPILSDLPLAGKALFSFTPLVYLSWIAVPLTWLFLYRTPAGKHIRAVGENQDAARTAGISVRKMQYLALILGGVLCGLAGASLSLGDLGLFRENMVSGRGFIALAAVYFASGRPGLTTLACLVFGTFSALQFRLQTTSSIPVQFFQMLPYIIVVAMLTLISYRKEWRKGW